MRTGVLIGLFFLITTFVKGQNGIEYSIFSQICEVLEDESQRCIKKSKITSFDRFEDWNTGETIWDTIQPLTAVEKELLSTMTEDELIEVLETKEQPMYPLGSKFTLLDTINFFDKSYKLKGEYTAFAIEKKQSNSVDLSIYKYVMEGEQLIIAFAIPDENKCLYLNCYFEIGKDGKYFDLVEHRFIEVNCKYSH